MVKPVGEHLVIATPASIHKLNLQVATETFDVTVLPDFFIRFQSTLLEPARIVSKGGKAKTNHRMTVN